MIHVKSRTKIGLAAVRILANGATDLPKAVEAQKGFQLMPLSAYLRYGLAYKRPAERPQMELFDSKAPEGNRRIRSSIRRQQSCASGCLLREARSADQSPSITAHESLFARQKSPGWSLCSRRPHVNPYAQGFKRGRNKHNGGYIIGDTWEAIARAVPECVINCIACMIFEAHRTGRREAYTYPKEFVSKNWRSPTGRSTACRSFRE